jgi:hypothetical protein
VVAGLGRVLSLVALGAAALAAFVTLSARGLSVAAGVTLEVVPVPLDSSDPGRAAVGPLRYLGGLWLRSADPRFGGLSDLRVSPDGSLLLAVSDCGRGFTAALAHDAEGRLAGLSDARLVDLAGPDGRPLGLGEADAESLVVDGRLEIGFEGRARIEAHDASPPFAGPARRLGVPPGVGTCSRNGGVEAMASMGMGLRFLVCESRRGSSSTVPAWVGRDETWAAREDPLLFAGGWAGEPFRPTGAALLPGGDLLVVERRFPPMGARIVRVPRASLEGEGPLEPTELARLEPPLTVDNFEGVEARRDASGRTLVYLLSDDNNCASRRPALQRTLLLLFALEG